MAIGKLPDAAEEEADDGSIFAEINITPLTDVFLVLVIIFMVSALAVQVERKNEKQRTQQQQQEQSEQEKKSGIKVNLPQGQAQEIDISKQSLELVIPLDGDIQVGNKPIADADLDRLFQAAFTRDKGTQVILKADKGVQHGRVVNVMERAKAAGLTKLAIATAGH